jgi:hypothetical protein
MITPKHSEFASNGGHLCFIYGSYYSFIDRQNMNINEIILLRLSPIICLHLESSRVIINRYSFSQENCTTQEYIFQSTVG